MIVCELAGRRHQFPETIPLGVLQRPVGMCPVSVIIHEYYERDGQAAQKVDRDEGS